MDIYNFLLKYPYLDSLSEDFGGDLDTYTISLQQAIYNKKEFHDFRLPSIEEKPKNRGDLLRHQIIAQRYMSTHTLYDGVLLFHEPGTGKSCSSIAIAEGLKESGSFSKCIILVKGEPRIFSFMKEIAFVCTDGRYIPENWEELTDMEQTIRLKKKLKTYYDFGTFATFAKGIADLSDKEIRNRYSNSVVIIDEVHNIRPKNKEEKATYNQIHRFLHTIENKKIILLTGTPMKNSPSELATVMNLILPANNQMETGKSFNSEYMEVIGNRDSVPIYDVSDDGRMRLYHKFNGMISYLKALNDPTLKKRFIGERMGSLKHFIVYPDRMSFPQTHAYNEALSMDIKDEEDLEAETEKDITEKNEESGIYKNSKQASLFVFPDGSWGSQGFKKYVSEYKSTIMKERQTEYKLTGDLKMLLSSDVPLNDRLNNLRVMSAKYASLVENLLQNPKKNTFVYCGLVHGSGAILLSLILKEFGIKHGLVTGKTTQKQIETIRSTFNSPQNVQAAKMQVIIGTPTFAEAYSLMNVQQIHIMTPHWNYAETEQAIARGVRAFSHAELKKILGDARITVDVYQHVAVPTQTRRNLDLYMYQISEAKDISIKNVENLIKVSAYDCQLAKDRNERSDPYSRECDYKECDYYCMDINDTHPVMDTSSYFNIYDKGEQERIRKAIHNLFKMKSKYHLSEIVDLVDCYEIEAIKCLADMIATREKVFNKNGFSLVVREFKNIYYLTDNIDIQSVPLEADYFDKVYTVDSHSVKQLMLEYSNANLETTIRKLEESSGDIERFNNIIKNTPLHIQSMFVEYAFIAERKDIGVNVEMRRNILEIYKDYIKTAKGVTILVLDEKHFKCFKKDEWVTCPPDIVEAYIAGMQDRVKVLERNKFGYYGVFNKGTKKFFIRDVSSPDLVDNPDTRKKSKKRECRTGWHKKNLITICLAIDLPYEKSGMDKDELIEKIESKNIDDSKVNLESLTRDQLDMIYHWSNKGNIAICEAIHKWMETNDLMLIE